MFVTERNASANGATCVAAVPRPVGSTPTAIIVTMTAARMETNANNMSGYNRCFRLVGILTGDRQERHSLQRAWKVANEEND